MALTTTQVYRHELDDMVSYMDEERVSVQYKVWITETNNPRETPEIQYLDIKKGYKVAGTNAIIKASGTDEEADAAQIEADGGYNEGDVLELVGTFTTDDGGVIVNPFTATYTCTGPQTTAEVMSGLANAVVEASGTALNVRQVAQDENRPDYDSVLHIWAIPTDPFFATEVSLTTLTYTPNPIAVPPTT